MLDIFLSNLDSRIDLGCCNLYLGFIDLYFENSKLRNEWIKIRDFIVPNLIEKDVDLVDEDRYFNPTEN